MIAETGAAHTKLARRPRASPAGGAYTPTTSRESHVDDPNGLAIRFPLIVRCTICAH